MITENLSTLKIHKLTQAQYDRERDAGRLDENAIYLTPDVNDVVVPTKTSELTNDSGFITSQSLEGLATEDYVDNQIATIPTPDVSGQINAHNTATTSHNDIRTLIADLTTRLNTLANSDDTTLDQLSEIVDYIKANRELIESVTTNKINVSDIIDNLTTNVTNKPLSAAQGVALKGLIDAIKVPTKVSELTNDKNYLTSYTETDPTVPAWAKAETKPSYTKSEVGLGNVDNVKQYSASNPPPYPVTSVNGKTGAVTLTASDVGADASGTAFSAVSAHNTSTSAHEDIREQISQLAEEKATLENRVSELEKYHSKGTNLIPSSINADGTPYNGGIGYKEGYRLNSSGVEKAVDNAIVSGFIPYNGKDITVRIPNSSTTSDANYLQLYGANFELWNVAADGTIMDGSNRQFYTWEEIYGATRVIDTATNTQTLLVPKELIHADTRYVRVSAYADTTVTTDTFSLILNENTTDDEDVVAEDTTPDYVVAEAEATISKLFSHGSLGRTIRFIAISDTHEDSAESYSPQITISNKHAGQAIKYIADRIGLDFVAHLGDASSCGAWSSDYAFDVLCNDVKNINKFVFSGVRGIKNVLIPGNHDMISINGNALLNSGASILFGGICSGNKDRLGGYGYFDIDDAKVRVIYLNTSDSPSSAAYLALTQEQKNWLCETLIDVNKKDNAAEWKIILLSHAPLNFGGANISTDILIPYVNGGSYNGYSFTANSAKIISNIHGHVHCYSYGYIGDTIRRFTIPNACFVGANHYASRTEYADWTDTITYNKTADSGKDTAFSLVTMDLDSGMCYVDNYGAGIDREFSTVYRPVEGVVPTSISNISYSGDTAVGATLDRSKFTFIVNYSDGTTNVVTGAASVDPATIGVVGNNTVTVTYTEEGVSVIGTITVVGTEVSEVNLFNKNDPDIALGCRINSSGAAVSYRDGQLVTGWIEAKVGDTFTVTSDKAYDTSGNTYTGMCGTYKSDKSLIMQIYAGDWNNGWDTTKTVGSITIADNMVSTDHSSIGYVRFCIEYTDINSIVITKSGQYPELMRNEVPYSIKTDGTLFSDTGYVEGKRLNSGGVEKDLAGYVTTGYIPYDGQTIQVTFPTSSTTDGNQYVHLYGYDVDTDFGWNNQTAEDTNIADGSSRQVGMWLSQGLATSEVIDGHLVLTIPSSSINQRAQYIRVSANIGSGITDDSFSVRFIKN